MHSALNGHPMYGLHIHQNDQSALHVRSSLQCQGVTVATLNALMLVPSGREPVTGPSTKEGMMVTSSKPSDLLNSHAFFSAIVCKQIREKH